MDHEEADASALRQAMEAEAIAQVDVSQLTCLWATGGGTTHHMVPQYVGAVRGTLMVCSHCGGSQRSIATAVLKRQREDAQEQLAQLQAEADALKTPASEYTPTTAWVRIMVGYAMETAVDRTLPAEQARAQGYAWFDRWYAAQQPGHTVTMNVQHPNPTQAAAALLALREVPIV